MGSFPMNWGRRAGAGERACNRPAGRGEASWSAASRLLAALPAALFLACDPGAQAPEQATFQRTKVFLSAGSARVTTEMIDLEQQQADVAARIKLATSGAGGATGSGDPEDPSCVSAALWLFDEAGHRGNELCVFGEGSVRLADHVTRYRCVGSTCALHTWAGGVRSYWAGVHGGYFEKGVELDLCTEPFRPDARVEGAGSCAGDAMDVTLLPDASSPAGTWHMRANGARFTATIEEVQGGYTGTSQDEEGGSQALDSITWDPTTRWLEFRRSGASSVQWHRVRIAEGVATGRFSEGASPEKPGSPVDYALHVTGWNRTYLDGSDSAPRVWDILVDASVDYRARVRIDRDESGALLGRFKKYRDAAGQPAAGEDIEHDLTAITWDGVNLSFSCQCFGAEQVYTGVAVGRTIEGTFTSDGVTAGTFSGGRIEVLTYGLAKKARDARAAWQERSRRRLHSLLMVGSPEPIERRVDLSPPAEPFGGDIVPGRDDDAMRIPQSYTVREVWFSTTFVDPFSGSKVTRDAHGYLSVPMLGGPKFRALVAVNGHFGSAHRVMQPGDAYYWYGDSFARHGYVVLAIDISHREFTELEGDGDDPDHGNGLNPAITAPGLDTDWSQDGERAWDVMRAVDYLLTRDDVDPARILITGLSMGGEVTTVSNALDPRFAFAIASGYAPDLGTRIDRNPVHKCWQLTSGHGDLREYINVTDLQAMAAPRPFVLQTGRADITFCSATPPFANDKQAARRARAAYGDDVENFVHYLHFDEHRYHVGGPSLGMVEQGIRQPVIIEPASPLDVAWQADPSTAVVKPTLYDLIDALMR